MVFYDLTRKEPIQKRSSLSWMGLFFGNLFFLCKNYIGKKGISGGFFWFRKINEILILISDKYFWL